MSSAMNVPVRPTPALKRRERGREGGREMKKKEGERGREGGREEGIKGKKERGGRRERKKEGEE